MTRPLHCKLGFHLPMYWSEGDVVYHFFQTMTYDKRKCADCGIQLGISRKQLRLQKELAVGVARIQAEIKEYGHPLLTGITT